MIMTGCVKKTECRRYKRYFTNSSPVDLSAFRSETPGAHANEGKNTRLLPTQNYDCIGQWDWAPVRDLLLRQTDKPVLLHFVKGVLLS